MAMVTSCNQVPHEGNCTGAWSSICKWCPSPWSEIHPDSGDIYGYCEEIDIPCGVCVNSPGTGATECWMMATDQASCEHYPFCAWVSEGLGGLGPHSGDINADGVVDVQDVTQVVDLIINSGMSSAELGAMYPDADVQCSSIFNNELGYFECLMGYLDVGDVAVIVNMVLGGGSTSTHSSGGSSHRMFSRRQNRGMSTDIPIACSDTGGFRDRWNCTGTGSEFVNCSWYNYVDRCSFDVYGSDSCEQAKQWGFCDFHRGGGGTGSNPCWRQTLQGPVWICGDHKKKGSNVYR